MHAPVDRGSNRRRAAGGWQTQSGSSPLDARGIVGLIASNRQRNHRHAPGERRVDSPVRDQIDGSHVLVCPGDNARAFDIVVDIRNDKPRNREAAIAVAEQVLARL